ncbi:MAG: hypothetical protein IID18_02285 [Nitrospinae bacterium]|nr:hypothetical protein [Nitrospinota bacterium]
MTENLQKEIITAILTDELDRARALVDRDPERYSLLAKLLKQVRGKSCPLSALTADHPDMVVVFPSYTCGVGCPMCSAGFADRTQLFDDYLHLQPEQFNDFAPWIETASSVIFVGEGETLESPHTIDFLNQVKEKETILYTSGVPLNKKKIRSLIESRLDYLTFSFDGKTSLGHGDGKEKYARKFWSKVRAVQQMKEELESELPVVTLAVTVNLENIDSLDELIEEAVQHGIHDIMLVPMIVYHESFFQKSIFADYASCKSEINAVMAHWNRNGMYVHYMGFHDSILDSAPTCPYVDNWMAINGKGRTMACDGPVKIPEAVHNLPKEQLWNSFPLRYLRHLHLGSKPDDLPEACRTCWIVNLKEHSREYFRTGNNDCPEPILIYQAASRMKTEGRFREAEELFQRVIGSGAGAELDGQAWFHLGEMRLSQNDHNEALASFKQSVQYFFDHQMAFVYLYLLLMLEDAPYARRKEKFDVLSLMQRKREAAAAAQSSYCKNPLVCD